MNETLVIACLLAAPIDVIPTNEILSQPQYNVFEVPHIPDLPYSRTARLNEQSHAVGGNWACPYILSCPSRAFYYDGSAVHDFTAAFLDALPPDQFGTTAAIDVNENGDVLFRLTIIGVGIFPYLWRDQEEFVEIEGSPVAQNTFVWGMNDSGMVVGTVTTPNDTRAFVWTADEGVINTIEPPKGYDSTTARGISNAGDVVGNVYTDSSYNGRAFIYSNGAMTLLDPLPGDVSASAILVNDAGLVAGVSTDADYDDSLVIWKNGRTIDSVTIADEDVIFFLHQISEAGEIVGSYWPLNSSPQQLAFRWTQSDGFQVLNDIALSIPDLNLWEATGVNDAGEILVWGEYPGFVSGMFLLTQITPTPGDLDNDGDVDFDDFTQLLASWGEPGCNGALPCPADLDNDGDVDFDDFTTLLANWS